MSVEFVDTNVLIYAHDGGAGAKHEASVQLLERLFEEGAGAISIQVLSEFYAAATRKLRMPAGEAEAAVADLGVWFIHRPAHSDLIRASHLHRKHGISWWDAMILNSALESGCSVLWSEDFSHLQRFGKLTIRNPFRQ